MQADNETTAVQLMDLLKRSGVIYISLSTMKCCRLSLAAAGWSVATAGWSWVGMAADGWSMAMHGWLDLGRRGSGRLERGNS